MSEKFEVSPVVISRWKKAFLENSYKALSEGNQPREEQVDTEKLYAQIVQLKVENDLKKKIQEDRSFMERKKLIRKAENDEYSKTM